MKKTLSVLLSSTLLILFLLISEFSLSQEIILSSASDFMDWQNITKNKISRPYENKIKGSAHLNETFVLGSITTTNNIKYVGIPLRYNIYNDDIEFEVQKNVFLAISDPSTIKEIIIGDDTFVYTTKTKKKDQSLGFYKLTKDGKTQLLTCYNIEYIEAKETTGYAAAQPARYNRNPSTFFLKVGDNNPIRISKKKDLELIFGADSKEILKYVKKEKINLRKEVGLIKLVQFLNQPS